MKIEKISENQIRCTLNKEDLATRQLRVSELAYGSEKARALFRDMMAQASTEFNFDAEDIPLMIEAIPVSTECLVLIVTKVEDPDELDTRFSNFTPYVDEDEGIDEDEENAYADEILSCFEHISELLGESVNSDTVETPDFPTPVTAVTGAIGKVYSFDSLNELSELAAVIVPFYKGKNTLYKSPSGKYYLVVSISGHNAADFNKVCNIISEYGRVERINYGRLSFFDEHYEVIIKDEAVQVLSRI